MSKWAWIAYGCIWISVAVGVGVGIYFTKNANCLWAFLIPALITFKSGD